MSDGILTNPDAPLASAQRLVYAQQRSAQFPAALADPAVAILGKWLALHPDCRTVAGTPDHTWCEAAKRARRQGQQCATFRRRKHVTKRAENNLKWLALTAGYAGKIQGMPTHADAAVRSEAEKLMRALHDRRITWDQLTEGLKNVRSLVQTRGRKRARDKAVREPLVLAVSNGLAWREVVTPRELASVGRSNGWCTHEAEYAKDLKGGAVRFFLLETRKNNVPLALVSLRPRSREVEGARAPGNEPIPVDLREAVRALLDHFDMLPQHCNDLLALGLTSAVPDVDLGKPDLTISDMSVWFGLAVEPVGKEVAAIGDEEEDGSAVATTPAMLIRVKTHFALLCPMGRSMADVRFVLQQGHGAEFDSDDLLGRLLIGVSSRTVSLRSSPFGVARGGRS